MTLTPKKKQSVEGAILAITGFILFFDFMAVDARIFGYHPPQWIITISSLFQVSPLIIDVLTTIALLTVLAMMRTEREIGEFEHK